MDHIKIGQKYHRPTCEKRFVPIGSIWWVIDHYVVGTSEYADTLAAGLVAFEIESGQVGCTGESAVSNVSDVCGNGIAVFAFPPWVLD